MRPRLQPDRHRTLHPTLIFIFYFHYLVNNSPHPVGRRVTKLTDNPHIIVDKLALAGDGQPPDL